MRRPRQTCVFTYLSLVLWASVGSADDWPQWMGPTRDGVYSETGLVEQIPASGLKVKWRSPLGGGYSGPAVVGNRVLVMDYVAKEGGIEKNAPNARTTRQGQERVLCLDSATGKVLWQHSYDRPYSISYACGPRCTPTVVGDTVYTLGAEGDLFALDLATGKVRWHVNFADTFKAPTPIWGFASHPLVDGDRVVCMVGGKNSAVVAFDTKSGAEVWRSLSARDIGYCPATLLQRDNQRQLLVWHAEALCGLDPASGRLHWEIPLEPSYGMAICRPQIEQNRMYVSGVMGTAVMLELGPGVEKPNELWRGESKSAVYAANSTPLFKDGVVFGTDGPQGSLIAVDAATGERLWETFKATTGGERRTSYGTGFLTRAGDRYFIFTETGDLILARLDRSGYHELGRSHLLNPTGEAFGRSVVWTHPAYAGRHCFARNDEEIICVSLAADEN